MTPAPAQVWRAIETYLRLAYAGTPPSAVRERLQTLRVTPEEEFFASAVFERDSPQCPSRYSLRLGNRWYPHMKLTIDRRPDRRGFLFRADTHDRHCCPAPGSREYQAFTQLMAQNQTLAQAIDAAWADEGLPTFKTYLRDDLGRRQRAASRSE